MTTILSACLDTVRIRATASEVADREQNHPAVRQFKVGDGAAP